MESNPLVQYRLLGRDGFSAVRKTNTKKEKTSCRSTTNTKYKEDMRVQIFAGYVITTAISARSQ